DCLVILFFFQAEDGIRYFHVTGVQTCALPISGYLAGPNDVYVSMNLVRKNGLRRGDAITGAVRAPRDGEQGNQRQKFDPLVRLEIGRASRRERLEGRVVVASRKKKERVLR